MASDSAGLIDGFRRPEYTGENRCIPCTVVNSVIALVVTALLWVGVGAVPALVVFGLSLVSIYLRGYLVPGTPTLTKRYLPEWVLAYFDSHDGETPNDPEVDLEAFLYETGIVTECADRDDLCLSESFERAWDEQIEQVKAGERSRAVLGDLLDVSGEDLRFDSYGDAYVMYEQDRQIGRWESEAAFFADVAGAEIIPHYATEWEGLTPEERSGLLASLRLFLETCPACGAPVALGEETVESCCRSIEVFAVSCTDCEARLFEVKQPKEEAA